MKTFQDHYREFAAYCRGLTNYQLENVIDDERKRHREFPEDECYAACYEAAMAVQRERF